MPTYLDNRLNSSLAQPGPTCRQVYDHFQTCPLCQQATLNTHNAKVTNTPTPVATTNTPTPVVTYWTVEFNPTTVGLLLLLVLVVYLLLRKQ
jgi:hypothetical protein